MKVLTDWFPATTLPVRDGFYIVIVEGGWTGDVGVLELARWNGANWRGDDNSLWVGVRHWRGLAFDPAAVAPAWGYPKRYWLVPQP